MSIDHTHVRCPESKINRTNNINRYLTMTSVFSMFIYVAILTNNGLACLHQG